MSQPEHYDRGLVGIAWPSSGHPGQNGPGHLVVIEPGFAGGGRTVSALRKVYFTVQE
ncbi:hypothetical protein [Mesorhizobium sp. A556]